jgi:hypothetical protein
MPDSAPTLRRFQFRLRTLMLFVTLACVIASWIGWVLVKKRYDDQNGPVVPPPGWVPQQQWTGPPLDPEDHRRWMKEIQDSENEKARVDEEKAKATERPATQP